MRYRFTEIHLVGGNGHEHISDLKAVDSATNLPYKGTRAEWVAAIDGGASGFVHDRYGNQVDVYVNSNRFVRWLQTYADGVWTDNLLALPRY